MRRFRLAVPMCAVFSIACGAPARQASPPPPPLAVAPPSASAAASAAPLPAEEPAPRQKMSHCGLLVDGPAVDRAFLEKPTTIHAGVGTMSFEVTTSSKEAKAFFNQGLAYLHSYVWLEAARSFHQALRNDPNLAMAWWGLSRAEGRMAQSLHAKESIDRAKELAPHASPRERRYIDLRAQQMEAARAPQGTEADKKHAEYKVALEKALADDPSDAEMWVLRGNAEEPGVGGIGQAGTMGAVAFYESALARDPKHLGAHHYLVHALENSGRAAEAAAHGRVYAAAAFDVAHAQHMLGHVLPRLGKWNEALVQFQKADRIEDAYAKAEQVRPGDDWHHSHNLDLLGFTYLRLGQVKEAEESFRRSYETPAREPFAEGFQYVLIEFYLLRGRNDEALAMAQKMAKGTGSGRIVGHELETAALLALHRDDEARVASKATADALAELTAGDSPEAAAYKDYFGESAREAQALVDLRGPNPERGEAVLLEIVDAIAADPTIDGWGGGLITTERYAGDAERLGRTALVKSFAERMKKMDPTYVPGAARAAR
jgi:tetratricopeptide (TPR) repeat protein